MGGIDLNSLMTNQRLRVQDEYNEISQKWLEKKINT